MIADVRWQFELIWALAELHLSALAPDDFLWRPAPETWTVRPDPAGAWRADWADTEPDPLPVPTIGWLTWHIDYWWSAAIAGLRGQPVPTPPEVTWPGDGKLAVSRVYELAENWRALLDDLTDADLTRACVFPWGPDAGRTAGNTVLWVNVELTKNISEIGLLRMLRATTDN